MTTKTNHWPTYQKRWEFKGTPEEAVIFSGANGGYEARMQYEFMLRNGLAPSNTLFDYGCGALRGSIRLVDYLDDGNFFGGDISEGLLIEAIKECDRLKLSHVPILNLMSSFDVPGGYDFVLCNSVTVHIHPDDIQDLCGGIKAALSQTGKAFISIHPLDEAEANPHKWDGYRWWYKRSWISQEAAKVGLNLSSMPGMIQNRIPGQRKPIIPVVNTNMTEWMMEGTR